MEDQKNQGDNAKAEILDGVSKSSTGTPSAPPSPPPVTFSGPPKRGGKKE